MINNIINLGLSNNFSERTNKSIKIANIIALFIGTVSLPYYFYYQFIGTDFAKFFVLIISFLNYSVIFVNKKGYTTFSRFFIIILNNIFIFILSTFLGPDTYSFFLYFPLIAGSFIVLDCFNPKERRLLYIAFFLIILSIILDIIINITPFSSANLSLEHSILTRYFLMPFILGIFFIILYVSAKETKIYEDKLKKKNKELTLLKEKAEALEKTKSEFIAHMSHEIRTPMNTIIGFVDLTLLSDHNPEINEYLRHVSISANHLLHIINDILDYSKIEAHKMKLELIPFDLAMLISNLEKSTNSKAQAIGINFKVIQDKNIPKFVFGDPTRIRQILLNFISNSLKFTQRGEICLNIKSLGQEKNGITNLYFSVCDTGKGIAENKIEKIFDDFTQEDNSTTRNYGGTGLGLSITKKLIHLMKGTLKVKSEVDVGSEFGFSIKMKKAKKGMCDITTESPVTIERRKAAFCKKLIVLVVEDNSINMKMIKKILKRHDCTVIEAINGKIAIEKFLTKKIDIILMDVQMPEMNGIEATKEIRNMEATKQSKINTKKPIPIIAVTANILPEDRKIYIESGMDYILSKPINYKKLYAVMDRFADPEGFLINYDSNE